VDRYNFVQTHQTFSFWWHVAFSYWDWNFLICPYQSYSIKKNLENKISIFVDASNISCLWLWHAISSKSFSLVANQATTNSLISSGEACQWFTVTNNSVKVSFRTTGELLRQTSAILFIVYYAMLSFEIYRGFPIWNGNQEYLAVSQVLRFLFLFLFLFLFSRKKQVVIIMIWFQNEICNAMPTPTLRKGLAQALQEHWSARIHNQQKKRKQNHAYVHHYFHGKQS